MTPSNKNLFEQDTEEKSVYPDEFRSRVMGLMYVAKRSRPDILKEVAYLATKVAAPSTSSSAALKDIFNQLCQIN